VRVIKAAKTGPERLPWYSAFRTEIQLSLPFPDPKFNTKQR